MPYVVPEERHLLPRPAHDRACKQSQCNRHQPPGARCVCQVQRVDSAGHEKEREDSGAEGAGEVDGEVSPCAQPLMQRPELDLCLGEWLRSPLVDAANAHRAEAGAHRSSVEGLVLVSRLAACQGVDDQGPAGVLASPGGHVENGTVDDEPTVGGGRVGGHLLHRDFTRARRCDALAAGKEARAALVIRLLLADESDALEQLSRLVARVADDAPDEGRHTRGPRRADDRALDGSHGREPDGPLGHGANRMDRPIARRVQQAVAQHRRAGREGEEQRAAVDERVHGHHSGPGECERVVGDQQRDEEGGEQARAQRLGRRALKLALAHVG
mmetsp:Transcript_34314/g.85516  ORF Transcript_34314/g.85516 Transcript_34314/m.85516 type:complete len:328 (-) Transcript_34314:135-1118(-)